ncbi:MAG: hypothetical protein K2M87_01275 [Muribaculaceae bacterium]|nr:hypothetical protein [Muribaculaceae bacterium]
MPNLEKTELIKMLGRYLGDVKAACKGAGVPRSTYYAWRKSDPDFAGQCDLVIASFKNKLREERAAGAPPPPKLPKPEHPGSMAEVAKAIMPKKGDNELLIEAEKYDGRRAKELAAEHEDYIIKAMESAGLYDPALLPQVKAAAKLHASIDILFSQLDAYAPVQTEISREGNPRLVSNPIHEMIRRQTDTYTGILKTLGLNFETKAKPKEEDGIANLINELSKDDR